LFLVSQSRRAAAVSLTSWKRRRSQAPCWSIRWPRSTVPAAALEPLDGKRERPTGSRGGPRLDRPPVGRGDGVDARRGERRETV